MEMGRPTEMGEVLVTKGTIPAHQIPAHQIPAHPTRDLTRVDLHVRMRAALSGQMPVQAGVVMLGAFQEMLVMTEVAPMVSPMRVVMRE